MCGPTKIDGYAFCLGVDSLKGFYEAHADLQSLIRSVTYLIRGAIFRPKYEIRGSGMASLHICPLAELMDMYHAHEATKRHDKVYALLGMSSDDLSKAILSPNYGVPWKELFQQLVKFLLCGRVSVETWENKEIAVIKSRGRVIGRVSSVKSDQDDRENVNIIFKNTTEHLGYNKEWNAHRTLQASAKFVYEGDLVCLLEGTSKPTIIRPCKDQFAVIIIAATPPEVIETDSGSVRPPELSQSISDFPHDFLLIWDWRKSQEKPHIREEYKTMFEAQGRVQEHSKTEWEDHLGKATRLWNIALILEDSEEFEEAKQRLRESIEGYERALGKGHSHTLTVMETLALVCKKTHQWKEAEQLVLRVIETKKRMQGADDSDTLSSMASLALAYKEQGQLMKAKKLEMMVHLLKLRRAQITEKMVALVARSFDEEVLALLLQRKGDEIQITEGAVVEIARRFNKEVMTLLLDRKGDEIRITEEVVKAAAGNSRSGLKMMTLLLDRKGDEIQITEEVVKAAAGNEQSGQEVMTLLMSMGLTLSSR